MEHVIVVPLTLLLPRLGLGADGVYLAEPVTELVAGLLNLAMLLYIHRRLLRLPEACREELVKGGLTERHARCLLRLEDREEQLRAVRHIRARQMNVAQAEQYIERQLVRLQTTPAGKRTFILKDVRLFLNSVERGLRLVREAGIDARAERQDTQDDILLTIRIPTHRQK